MLARAHFAILPLGDRFVAGVVHGRRVEAFVVTGENPTEALRAEIEQRKFPVRTVALGLPRSSVTVKPIELPSVGGEIRQMVSFELERHLPFPSDDASFDYIMLPEDRATGATSPAGRLTITCASSSSSVTASRSIC